jgi:hypothetical protein
MRVQVDRYVIAAAAACVSLGTAASAGVAATPLTVNPQAAASVCAGPQAHAGPPPAVGVAKLSGLTSCVLRAERKQLGLGYNPSASLSGKVDDSLGQFIALPYLTQHQPKLASEAEQRAGESIARSFCAGSKSGVSRYEWNFAYHARPRLTPLQVADFVAGSLSAPGAIARAAGTRFGVAARSGLLFRHGDRNGVSLGVIAVTCG